MKYINQLNNKKSYNHFDRHQKTSTNKLAYPLMIKTVNTVGTERPHLNMIKVSFDDDILELV